MCNTCQVSTDSGKGTIERYEFLSSQITSRGSDGLLATCMDDEVDLMELLSTGDRILSLKFLGLAVSSCHGEYSLVVL